MVAPAQPGFATKLKGIPTDFKEIPMNFLDVARKIIGVKIQEKMFSGPVKYAKIFREKN